MKNISVYVKGDRNSTAYYRIYQYFDKISTAGVSYHIMYPLWVQNKYMPVSKQPKAIQFFIYFVAAGIVFKDLFHDSFVKTPDVLVIHKRLVSKYMPRFFRLMINRCHKKGCRIIWDFDDHLVEGHEMNQSTFEFFSSVSDMIVVTHDYLKSLLPSSVLEKVHILPTTDGDMYGLYENMDLMSERKKTITKELRLVWVATSANIRNLLPVIPYIDEAATVIEQVGKKVVLSVICDKPIEVETKSLIIKNVKWTRDAAIEGMRNAHVGIMPLQNTKYNKGKGGFKLVQYISIGLPCVGSNVGFNGQVITPQCGVLTNDESEWTDAIIKIADVEAWESFSTYAYSHWLESFSFKNNLSFWKHALI